MWVYVAESRLVHLLFYVCLCVYEAESRMLHLMFYVCLCLCTIYVRFCNCPRLTLLYIPVCLHMWIRVLYLLYYIPSMPSHTDKAFLKPPSQVRYASHLLR